MVMVMGHIARTCFAPQGIDNHERYLAVSPEVTNMELQKQPI